MDVVNEIEVLENNVKDCNEKCQRVNCSAIYDAIMSSFRVVYICNSTVPIYFLCNHSIKISFQLFASNIIFMLLKDITIN